MRLNPITQMLCQGTYCRSMLKPKKEKADVCGRTTEHSFGSATIVSCRLVSNDAVSVKTLTFDSVDSLWEYIYSFTKSNFTTWLVGHDVLYSLILCGLPYRFQCGELSIDKPRAKRKRENNDPEDPHTFGLAVIEGPPTIIGCRVGQTQGELLSLIPSTGFAETYLPEQCPTKLQALMGILRGLRMTEPEQDGERWAFE